MKRIDTQDKIEEDLIKGFIDLYEGRAKGFPEWNLFESIFEPTFENKEFANRVFYVLNDLFSPIEYFSFKIRKRDKENKLLTVKICTTPANKVGFNTKKEVLKLNENNKLWNLYKDKPLKQIKEWNKNAKIYEIPKYTRYLKQKLEIDAGIEVWAIGKKYKDAFSPDSAIKPKTFEQFIKIYFPKQERPSKQIDNTKKTKPSIRGYALYYYYLHEKGINRFDRDKRGSTKAIKEVTDKLGIDNREFRREYTNMYIRSNRLKINNDKDKRFAWALDLLSENEIKNKDAIALCKSEYLIVKPLN